MKLKNVGIQVAEKKHLAELIVNNMTMIENASSSDVKFAKLPSETNFKTVKDIQESCSVDDLVNIRGKFIMDGCTAAEKIVRGQQKTMMENCVLMDDTGFVNITLWANFRPHLEELVSSSNFLSLFILLLIPFTLLCLTNCKQSFLYHKRNLYITNIFNYTRLNFKVFNNNVSNIIHPLPISGIAYKLDGDFPSKNFTHKIHYKSRPEAHTIKLVFFPLLFLFMVTISNWIRKDTFSYYTSIKHKYLFLKS